MRIVALALWVATLVGLVVVVRDRVDDLRDLPALPTWPVLLAVVAIHVAGNGLLVTAWRRIVSVVSVRLGWFTAARVWSLSQLARFSLAAAQVGARAALARRHGVAPSIGAVTTLVEISWTAAITPLLILATWPAWSGPAASLSWVPWVAIVPAAVLVLGLVAPSVLLRMNAAALRLPGIRRFGARYADRVDEIEVPRRMAAELSGVYLGNTLLRLVAFLVVVAAMSGPEPVDAAAVGAFALGQFVGRIALFAPGGIGPREGATVLVLTQTVGGPAAVGIVAVTRVAEFAGELAFAALAAAGRRQPS
jgi:glycosyltransferase 2 family protein